MYVSVSGTRRKETNGSTQVVTPIDTEEHRNRCSKKILI